MEAEVEVAEVVFGLPVGVAVFGVVSVGDNVVATVVEDWGDPHFRGQKSRLKVFRGSQALHGAHTPGLAQKSPPQSRWKLQS